MFEEIKNRIAHLTQTKKDIESLYLLSEDEVEQTGLAERNMQISMELSFLNTLLQYDVMAMLPTAMINRFFNS